jgi:SAM-dependent methyltransferase
VGQGTWQIGVAELLLEAIAPFERERAGPVRLLEAGCGSAPIARCVAARSSAEIICCDAAEPAELPERVRFECVDLCGPLPFADESFDAVTCTEVLEHLKAQFLTLEQLARVLRTGGLLFFTVPNYWNARHRWRYLLTGSLSTTRFFDPKARGWYRENICPHITNTTLPMFEYALASMGLAVEAFRVGVNPAKSRLFWPVAAGIRFVNLFRRPKHARRLMLAHTNRWRILVGGEQIMLMCRKVGFDNVPYDVRPLRRV